MKMLLYSLLALFTLAVACSSNSRRKVSRGSQKNVLFLASDDMRPQLGAYQGADFPVPHHIPMHTPHLDALARRSMLLKKAYVQVAVCNPSRSSLLTSRRPDTTHVYDLVTYFREAGGNFTTIPQYFKEHGYITAGNGKIFHPGKKASDNDDPISWTEPYYHGHENHHYDKYHNVTWTSVAEAEWSQFPLQDQLIANHTIQNLRDFAATGKPFFLAAGFHRPHLPFIVPEKYFQYYPPDDIQLPSNPYAPDGMPQIAWSDFDEIRKYKDIHKYGYGNINSTFPDHVVKDLRRAYYAAITYVDDMIGRILDVLDQLGLAENTIVSFWGDHGWQLGEHGEWCKHTNFELTTRAPMMIAVPGVTDQGIEVEQLTEFVDLFPTLAEAAGLTPLSLCPEGHASALVKTCTEGSSLMSLAENPRQAWKNASFSQYPRMAMDGNIIMGYTMRTQEFRYTEWLEWHGYPAYAPDWNQIFHGESAELYDHRSDPEENINRAYHSDYLNVRSELSRQLHAGWRKAMPS